MTQAQRARCRSSSHPASPGTLDHLHDAANPAPFANLRTDRGDSKAHGITGAIGDFGRVPPKSTDPIAGD